VSNLAIIAMTALAAAASLPDQRDGQVYRTVIIGQARWFAQNLNYETPDSRCHGELAANCALHGRLYRWDEAMTACPPGWHLPSDREWQDLEIAIGMNETDTGLERARGEKLGDRLKPGGDTGFDARFSGYSDPHRGGAYVRLGERAAFWTSTDAGRDEVSALAWHRDISENRSTIWRSKVNQTYRLSVRCLADSDQVVASTGAPPSMSSRLPGL
jgi:uncharacterized protein (TIGR02145 family)